MAKYTKSYSNYILRSNPSPSKDGYIYENDLPTTSRGYNSANGISITTTDGGFTFVANRSPEVSKDYNTEGWGNATYTLSGLTTSEKNKISSVFSSINSLPQQKYVDLNTSYSRLSDYCYFGSANAMLKAAIDEIIINFPAGIYATTTVGVQSGSTITLSRENIENKFFLDLFNYYSDEIVNMPYDLRVLATSFTDYEVVLRDETLIGYVTGFTGYTTGNTDEITFDIDGVFTTGDTLLIRPIKTKRDEFFNSLDDFQKDLLNQNTTPKYKSYFKIPRDGENGIEEYYSIFVWATGDGYNIDIESTDYNLFINDLIKSTNLIDELYCDNLYRMLTHDTIKNLDTTYAKEEDGFELEEIIVGGTKIQKLLRLYGRSFDELKRYINGISFSNTISYNNENNLPKEYLTGRLNVSGWDGFSLINNDNKLNTTVKNLFPATNKQYTIEEVNNELIRRIITNSKHIFSSKGTRKSIRKILGLFGLDESWYEINEFVQKIDSLIDPTTTEKFASLNYGIYPQNYTVSDGKDPYEYLFKESLFDNTNIGITAKCPYCGNENYIVSGDTEGDYNTGVCINDITHVFNITGNTKGYPKPLINSTNYYFQQKGNWYRETGGVHTDSSGNTYVNETTIGNNPHIGNGEYDNGYDYISQFENIFKRYVRNVGDTVDTEYINSGFTISKKKEINNSKIEYYDDSFGTGDTYTKGKLDLNLKNLVIGIDGDKVLDSFFNEGGITTIYGGEYTITDESPTMINIINQKAFVLELFPYLQMLMEDGSISGVESGNDYIGSETGVTTGKTMLIHLSENSTNSIQTIGGIMIEPGTTWKYVYDGSNWVITRYYGEDEVRMLKEATLPYLEQIIPSTSIFDFSLIDRENPKWLMVDHYCDRDVYGNFNGYEVLAYQNINNYDLVTDTGGTIISGLTALIAKDFGDGFVYDSIITKENNDGETEGFDDIYIFKKSSQECGANVDPNWEKTNLFT